MDKIYINNLLENSFISEDLKSLLRSKLDKLSENILLELDSILSVEAKAKQAAFVKFLLDLQAYTDKPDSTNPEALGKLFESALKDPELEFGRSVLGLVEDVFNNFAANKKESFSPKLLSFIYSFVTRLSSKGLSIVLGNFFVDFVKNSSEPLLEFEKAYFLATTKYDGGVWGRQFVPVLKQNQELLGSKQIKIAGKEVAQTVQHWLEDYVGFVGKADGQREALDRINFVNKSSNVKLLTEEERKTLLQLLEIFDWFCDPYVTKEVVEYFEGPRESSVPARGTTTEGVGAGAAAQASQNTEQAVVEPSEKPVPTATGPQATNNLERRAQTVVQSKPASRVETVTKKKVAAQVYLEEPLLPPPPHEELLEPAHGLLSEVGSSDSGQTIKGTNTQPSPGMGTAGDVDTEKLEQERISKGVKMPSLAKPLVVGVGKQEVGVKIPPKLDLDEIKTQAQKQKQEVQEDIDDKLEDLSEHM